MRYAPALLVALVFAAPASGQEKPAFLKLAHLEAGQVGRLPTAADLGSPTVYRVFDVAKNGAVVVFPEFRVGKNNVVKGSAFGIHGIPVKGLTQGSVLTNYEHFVFVVEAVPLKSGGKTFLLKLRQFRE